MAYQILDEPRPGKRANLVVDPSGILLASMVIPLLWQPPLHGRFWLPFLWLLANSWFMGSPTFRRELRTSITSLILLALIPFLSSALMSTTPTQENIDTVVPYIRVLMFGFFFFSLYYVATMQAGPYAIFTYLRPVHDSA